MCTFSILEGLYILNTAATEGYILHIQVLLEFYYMQMESPQWKIEIISFCRKVSFSKCRSKYQSDLSVSVVVVTCLFPYRAKDNIKINMHTLYDYITI